MKSFILSVALTFSVCLAFAGFEGIDKNADSLGVINRIECSTNLTCTKVKDKFKMALGIQSRVLATATTIIASQCGSTFYNAGAVKMDLPEASAVLGCRLTFITANAANFDVDPDAADQILVLTDAAGDKIRNATLGNSVTIEAISASQWAVVGEKGTWSDAN